MAQKNKVVSRRKVETIEEYLSRGGSIKLIPSVPNEPQPEVVRKTTQGGPAVFLSLEEADLFFGEPSKKKAKKTKPAISINIDVLPPALRAKFISKLKEEVDGEGYEEELEEVENFEED
jgi:hypothetical protein